MITILTHRRFYPTANNLKDALQEEVDIVYSIKQINNQSDLVIRWGNFSDSRLKRKDVVCEFLNEGFPTNNKKVQSILMKKCGVNVPERLNYLPEEDIDIVARKLKHSQARDAKKLKINDVSRLSRSYQDFMRFYNIRREYRVHIFKGEVILFQVKKEGSDNADPIWRSHRLGWMLYGIYNYHTWNQNYVNSIFTEAKNAVQALDLDFGAVDIGIITETNKPIVFEVNTAPGLGVISADKYASAIKAYIGG